RQRGGWEVDARAIGGGRPIFGSEEDAHAHATELLKHHGSGLVLDVDRNITFRAYVERWKPAVEPDLEPRTYAGYVRLLDDHVLPVLGRMRVRDVRVRHIRTLLKAKRADGYAKNTCRLIRAAL